MRDEPKLLFQYRDNITPNLIRNLITHRCSRTLEALLEFQEIDWTIIAFLDLPESDLIYLASIPGWYEIMKSYTFHGNHNIDHFVDLLVALDPSLELLWYIADNTQNVDFQREIKSRGYKKPRCCIIC